jgi:hypothetical protein
MMRIEPFGFRDAPVPTRRHLEITQIKGATLYRANALDLYAEWPTPTVIFSDGAYGVNGFPGDPPNANVLGEWYEPHVAAWSEKADGGTTPRFILFFLGMDGSTEAVMFGIKVLVILLVMPTPKHSANFQWSLKFAHTM